MTTTPPDARNALAEIVAGLDGVTPGPWDAIGYSCEYWLMTANECLQKGYESAFSESDANHIARCDPATMRSIADLVSSQDARIAALEAQVEGMREIEAAAKAYVASVNGEPEKDCWDTENGEEAEGAERFASDWSWREYDAKKQAAFDRLRAALQSSETTGEQP